MSSMQKNEGRSSVSTLGVLPVVVESEVLRDAAVAAGPPAWADVNVNVGALSVRRVGLSYTPGTPGKATVLVDACLTAAGLEVAVSGLAISMELGGDFKPSVDVRGLGADFNRPPLRIAAEFINEPPAAPYDLLLEGAALLVTPAATFQAAGEYARLSSPAITSLFLYARGQATEGLGPPQFQIRGLSAGFGFNSRINLPSPGQAHSFPLMPGPGPALGPREMLEDLAHGDHPWVSPCPQSYWAAAGISVSSCELVTLDALAVVEWARQDWSVALLGVANAQFPKAAAHSKDFGLGKTVVRLELEVLGRYLSATGLLAAEASLTENSYFLAKECRPTGGAATNTWLTGEHKGDFVFSIGGYHPDYAQPEWYPEVQRVGYIWAVSDQIAIKGQGYCSLTPGSFMVGNALDINAEVTLPGGYAKAWFHAGFNSYIEWNPFHMTVSADISAGAEAKLLLAHAKVEVSLSLDFWLPPFGGAAYAKLPFGIKIPIEFGAKKPADAQPLTWAEFAQEQLPEPSTRIHATPLRGLLPGTSANPGDDAHESWPVSHDFTFDTGCVVPSTSITVNDQEIPDAGNSSRDDGNMLCIRPLGDAGRDLKSVHAVKVTRGKSIIDVQAERWSLEVLTEDLPEALWGEPLEAGMPPVPKGGTGLIPGLCTGLRLRPPGAHPGQLLAPVSASSLRTPEGLRRSNYPLSSTTTIPAGRPTVAKDESAVTIIAETIESAGLEARNELHEYLSDHGYSVLPDDPLKAFSVRIQGGLFTEPPLIFTSTP